MDLDKKPSHATVPLKWVSEDHPPLKREETNKKYLCKPSSILFEDKVL
jgi:hypothetical protein